MRSNDRASHGPRARRLRGSIPAAGCRNGGEATAGQANREANEAGPRATPRSQRLCGLWLGSPQPGGLKPFVDFCLAVSRRPRPADCFAGYDAAPAARRCGVARSGETAAGIAQHSRLQKSATVLQRPSWDFISVSLSPVLFSGSNPIKELQIHRWIWSGRRDSNPRHQPWQGCTLPTELRPHKLKFYKYWSGSAVSTRFFPTASSFVPLKRLI